MRVLITEMMVFIYLFLHNDLAGTKYDQLKELLFWTILFGPCLFPLSLIIWHSYQLSQGEANFMKFENVARSRVLNSLSVLTKSAVQVVLQTSIMMVTWHHHQAWLNVYRLCNVGLALIVLSGAATNHHYFVSRAKNIRADREVKLSRRFLRFLFNILHLLCRGFVISLLASYLHFLIIIFICLMIITNFTIALFTVQSMDASKHLLTAVGSVLLPKCFVSRDSLENKPVQYGAKMFERYYRLNSINFFLVFSVLGLITANCVIRWTDINTFPCDVLPFLSENPQCEDTSAQHSLFYLLGNILVVFCSALSLVLVHLQELVIRDTGGDITVLST